MMHPMLSLFLLAGFLSCCLSAHASISDEREFTVINAASGLADNSAQIVVCTKTGRMIISTLGNLNFYDGSTFTHIDTHQKFHYLLPAYRGHYRLYFDHYHHIWLKNHGYVTCVDLLQEQFIANMDSVVRQVFGCDDSVEDLFVDSNGELWLLTDKGIYDTKEKKTYQVMRDRNLQDLDVMNNLLITIYDNGEEIGINLLTGQVDHRSKCYERDEMQRYLGSSVISPYKEGFFQIRNGYTDGILLYFDIRTHQWQRIIETGYHLNNMALHGDCLYVAAEYGYWIYDIKTGEKKHIEELKLYGSNRTLKTECNTLSFDKQGGMWIGTEKRGLLYARPIMSPFNVYGWDHPMALKYSRMMEYIEPYVGDFKGIKTNCYYKDSRGWTWFGTTMGLYMYRTPQSEPVVFTKKSGFLNNVIHSIVEDLEHNVWVSTSCGISCILFDGEKISFVNSFSRDDNVPNESFVNCKAKCLEDGTVIMQAIDHVVAFRPDKLDMVNKRQPTFFNPKLVKLLVNGNYVAPRQEEDGNVIIDRAITRAKEISLNANQNSISLTFSGLNYFRPLQTFYRVKVKGLADEWKVYSYFDGDGFVDRRGMLHLPLIGLKPKTYEVSVQASLFPDIWSDEEPYTWIVKVNQPWWQTSGVYWLLGLITFVILLVNIYYYGRNTRMRAKLNSEEGDLIRKIRSFTERCYGIMDHRYEPSKEDAFNLQDNELLTPAFMTIMSKVMPYVKDNLSGQLTVHKLSEVGGVDVAQFYKDVSGQLYKNPRLLARHILLNKAALLLKTTDKPVEQIANECGFYTPNFFIGNFFHEYKMTPKEYREENRS